MCNQIASYHRCLRAAQKPKLARANKKRGRHKFKHVRNQFSAWNAFVKLHPPVAHDKRAHVKSGDHLKELSALWKRLPPHIKSQYTRISLATKLQKNCNDEPIAVEESAPRAPRDVPIVIGGVQGEAQWDSPWDIGTASVPLKREYGMLSGKSHACMETGKWLDDVSSRIQQSSASVVIPKKGTYEAVCAPGACRAEPQWDLACRACQSLFSKLRIVTLGMYMFEVPCAPIFIRFGMVAYLKKNPRKSVFLMMQVCAPSCENHSRPTVGFPWFLQMARQNNHQSGRKLLDFCTDEKFTMALAKKMPEPSADGIKAYRLEYMWTQLDTKK